jgi:hypothetical protein
MLKRHEVEILLKAGHSKVELTRLTGISLRSVNRIAEEAPVVHVDDAAEREKRQIGRPSKVDRFRKFIVGILEENPDLPSLEILRRVREPGYPGGKTALYALVSSLCAPEESNRWSASKAYLGNLVSMTLDQSTSSSWAERFVAPASLPLD